ncbi:hypothetical protein BaRGS_00034522 [Batillaria attramentaria]|uniref:Uncharacterized protein n=1 Tax=Batillaria attramentaria TaxID=370345 RepID=A0ABD0JH36_9CAEN
MALRKGQGKATENPPLGVLPQGGPYSELETHGTTDRHTHKLVETRPRASKTINNHRYGFSTTREWRAGA